MPEAKGRLSWIGLRESTEVPIHVVEQAQAVPGQGLEGDRFRGRPGGAGTRQITLIHAAHLLDAAQALGQSQALAPTLTRRNLVIEGLHERDLRQRQLRIGEHVLLEITGGCPPCSQMDTNIGDGGRAALEGRGGLTARVVTGGELRVGDTVVVIDAKTDD